jgi:hypothetical protein
MVFCGEVDELYVFITGKSVGRWYWDERNSVACHCDLGQFVLQLSAMTLLNLSPPVTSSQNSCKVIFTRSSCLRSTCQLTTSKSSSTRYYEVSGTSPLKHTRVHTTCFNIKTPTFCLHSVFVSFVCFTGAYMSCTENDKVILMYIYSLTNVHLDYKCIKKTYGMNSIEFNSYMFIILILLYILREILLYKQVYSQLIAHYLVFTPTCFGYRNVVIFREL